MGEREKELLPLHARDLCVELRTAALGNCSLEPDRGPMLRLHKNPSPSFKSRASGV